MTEEFILIWVLCLHWSSQFSLSQLNCSQLLWKSSYGVFLVVQWLRLCSPNVVGKCSIPRQGTRSYVAQLKIPCVATKTQHSPTPSKKVATSLALRELAHDLPKL